MKLQDKNCKIFWIHIEEAESVLATDLHILDYATAPQEQQLSPAGKISALWFFGIPTIGFHNSEESG